MDVADQKNPSADPFTAWRDWLGQAERQLNSFFNDVMGSAPYTRAMGQFNTFSMSMQKNMAETMGRYLTSLNLPKPEDLAALGRRLAALEERLSAMESRQGGAVVTTVAPPEGIADAPRPPRTRKPSRQKVEAAKNENS